MGNVQKKIKVFGCHKDVGSKEWERWALRSYYIIPLES